MGDSSVIGTLLLIITGLITYKGEKESLFKEAYLFHVDAILIGKDYKRLITSGFLHSGWIHFGFNMVALLSFSSSLESVFGIPKFILIYFISMLGGNLLALFIHKNHGDYRALGASGAISGVVFASIFLFPENKIGFIGMPPEAGIPSWLFGAFFILVSIFGIKNQSGNISHEAHLGGAIIGGIVALFFAPDFANINWFVVIGLLAPTIAFLVLIVRNPTILLTNNYWGETIENIKRSKPKRKPKAPVFINKEAELNHLLEKIRNKGIHSLSTKERSRLEELKNEL